MSQEEKVPHTAGAVGLWRRTITMRIVVPLGAITAVAAVLSYGAPASGQPDGQAAPIFVDKIPAGYRDWRLISVAHEEGNLKSLGAILGNEVAIRAFREKNLPFPDGTIIAALHWRHTPSEENNKIFGRSQSFVPGPATNVQFMVKDSKKYSATGGWGFGHFNERNGKPAEGAFMQSCFPCHQKAKDSDLVFTRYSP